VDKEDLDDDNYTVLGRFFSHNLGGLFGGRISPLRAFLFEFTYGALLDSHSQICSGDFLHQIWGARRGGRGGSSLLRDYVLFVSLARLYFCTTFHYII